MNRLPLKICGITRDEDARLCAEIGAAYAGFIFASKSPRRLTPELAKQLDTGGALRVGVFTGTPPEEIRRIMALARLDYAQLHGGESPAVCGAVGPDRVIKVLWPEALVSRPEASAVRSDNTGNGETGGDVAGNMPEGAGAPEDGKPGHIAELRTPDAVLAALRAECERFAPVCAMFLLDAGQSGGGSGRSLPFEALRDFHPPRPWLLAGGLGPDNLAEASALCSPYAFDCNSGLEEAPGRKSPALVRAAAAVVRGIVTEGPLPPQTPPAKGRSG